MTNLAKKNDQSIVAMDDEQLPIPQHRLHGSSHFLGLYAAEHVAASEFVIGAAFVALGASINDILIGLLIGNALAILSFWLITAPIAVKTRLSLYTYLDRNMGDKFSRFYNSANVLIFVAISAAMITVSATAVRVLFDIPPQVYPYPTNVAFAVIAASASVIAVAVAYYGFNVLSEFASICAPWLMVMFTAGGMVLIPSLNEALTGYTTLSSFSDFVNLAGTTVFTGINTAGEPGIGLWEVIGFAWAANTFAHFGLVDMALLRYAKKSIYGLCTATGMLFGHYIAWISAALMGAATAAIMKISIAVVSPGDVAYYALGATGFIIVIVAGWTTANSNLYRAGLAAQAVFPRTARQKVTLVVGAVVVVASCFPYVYRNILPLLTYAGLILVPIGGIVFAEQHLFPRMGMKTNWYRLSGVKDNVPALATWAISLVFGFGLNFLNIISFFYLFLPTWVVSIVVYTVLSKWAGAEKSYPEAEKREQEFDSKVAAYHADLAAKEKHVQLKDRTVLTKVIRAIWIIVGLLIPAVLAWRVLFNSPDLYAYFVNRELFYDLTIWCTLIYFVFAWWDLQRSKSVRLSSDA
ncbi:mannitol permease [Methylophaga thiooxydans]|uniref:Mannitol permease n=1 Tax=Methylophaga thiooxydans TaxID=392484 RepID=A0A0A0BJ25_9GAMM|nr:membrane protein [Methylophaga thiooxydans]KGM07981.1 mannitol permease [Methylophaga thiooxydans]